MLHARSTMELYFVVTELSPVLRASNAADAVFSLTKALKSLGHRVTVAMPRYDAFERAGILVARRLTPMKLPGVTSPKVPSEVVLFDARLSSGVDLVLFDAKGPDGESLYHGVEAKDLERIDPADALSVLRFSTLCRAAVEHARQRAIAGQPYDVLHAHDWATAPTTYLARDAEELAGLRTVLTLHDLEGQVVFGREALGALGLDAAHFTPETLEFYGGVSFAKAGILAADAITAPSPAYAAALLTPEGGERLDGVLRARAGRARHPEPVVGIQHGIDASVYNPAIDSALATRYDADDFSNKGRCKSALLKSLELEIAPERPLFVYTGRLDEPAVLAMLVEAARYILKQDGALLLGAQPALTESGLAGGGSAALEALRAELARAPQQSKLLQRCDEPTAHRLLAAADFVLVPALREPTGVPAARAQRYGAVPVASRTGGLVDAVVDADAALESGTGFLFDEPTGQALVGGIGRAFAAYANPRFAALVRRVLRLELGWDRPARRYAQLYRSLAGG